MRKGGKYCCFESCYLEHRPWQMKDRVCNVMRCCWWVKGLEACNLPIVCIQQDIDTELKNKYVSHRIVVAFLSGTVFKTLIFGMEILKQNNYIFINIKEAPKPQESKKKPE